ncbi:MAG: indole-3-glycerol phosphate synthase TrpC [Candidatus Omnitrophota bacterium]
MNDFLDKIIAHKRSLLKRKKAFFDVLKTNVSSTRMTRYGLFKENISRAGQINLIAEIKKASPSQGVIRPDFNVEQLARVYADNGAAALSVLTENKFFLGRPEYVRRVSEIVPVPVLTKDFIIDEAQIYEAFLCGASAILLIVAILEDAALEHLLKVAAGLDLDCLVEIHQEDELQRALRAGADIIGINHRDLRTFEVDLNVSQRLIPRIPDGKVIVAESGIRTHADVQRLQDLGVHAVLIGEMFMRAEDVGAKVREIMTGRG